MRSKSIATRSIRRARRYSRVASNPRPYPRPAAVQVFLFKVETFLGAEVFDATNPVSVGRHPESQVRLEGETVSRNHCRFIYENAKLYVEDLGSGNGTYLNRVPVQGKARVYPADALHIGPYTLKVKGFEAMSADPKGPMDDEAAFADTKLENVLNGDHTGESPVDLSGGFDQKLYEDAMRRKSTGTTSAQPPLKERAAGSQLRIVPSPTEPERQAPKSLRNNLSEIGPIPGDSMGAPDAGEDSTTMAAEELPLAVPAPRIVSPDEPAPKSQTAMAPGKTLDPAVEARLKDLDQLIASLDAQQVGGRASSVPWATDDEDMSPTTEFDNSVAEAQPSKSKAEAPKIIPLETPKKAEPAPQKLASQIIERVPAVQEPMDEDSTTLEHEDAVSSAGLPKGIHEAQLLTPPPQSGMAPLRNGPIEDGESALDDVWASRVDDKSPQFTSPMPKPLNPLHRLDRNQSIKQGVLSEASPRSVPPPLPKKRAQPPKLPRKRQMPALPQNRQKTQHPPMPQKSSFRAPSAGIKIRPVPHGQKPKTVVEVVQVNPKNGFDGVEVTCRFDGRLIDIAVLRKEDDQYILGHPTPQGSVAPAKMHVGLRLLRINKDRTVDLVFPKDAGGRLQRGPSRVQFQDLTEGRKYSCLRLENQDEVNLVLGEGKHAFTYNVRFLHRPRSIFRALRQSH